MGRLRAASPQSYDSDPSRRVDPPRDSSPALRPSPGHWAGPASLLSSPGATVGVRPLCSVSSLPRCRVPRRACSEPSAPSHHLPVGRCSQGRRPAQKLPEEQESQPEAAAWMSAGGQGLPLGTDSDGRPSHRHPRPGRQCLPTSQRPPRVARAPHSCHTWVAGLRPVKPGFASPGCPVPAQCRPWRCPCAVGSKEAEGAGARPGRGPRREGS